MIIAFVKKGVVFAVDNIAPEASVFRMKVHSKESKWHLSITARGSTLVVII